MGGGGATTISTVNLTKDMIHEHYPKSMSIHADGSAENVIRNGGNRAYISYPDGSSVSLSNPAGEINSNYRIEMQVLVIAIEHLTIKKDNITQCFSLTPFLNSSHFYLDTDHITKLLQTKLNILAQSPKMTIQ